MTLFFLTQVDQGVQLSLTGLFESVEELTFTAMNSLLDLGDKLSVLCAESLAPSTFISDLLSL